MAKTAKQIQAAQEAAEQAQANEVNDESEAPEGAAAPAAAAAEAEELEIEEAPPVDPKQAERERLFAKRKAAVEREVEDSVAASAALQVQAEEVTLDAEGTSEDTVVRAQQLRDRAKKLDKEAAGEGAADATADGKAIDRTEEMLTLKIFGVDREYPKAKVMAGGGPEVYAKRVAAEMRLDQAATREAEVEAAAAKLEARDRDLAKREAELRKRPALPAAGEGSGPSAEGRSEQRAVEVSNETIKGWAGAVFAGADEASIETATRALLSEVQTIRSGDGAISQDQVQQIVRDAIAADRNEAEAQRKSDEAAKRKTAFTAANKVVEAEFPELTVKGSRENNLMNAEFKTLLADASFRGRPLTDVAREAGKRALALLNPEPEGGGPDLEARRRAKRLGGPRSQGSGLKPKTAVTEAKPRSRQEYVNDLRKGRGQPPLG